MTAPTINGTKYPQPIEDLLPAARALVLPEGQKLPSRNRLMREFHIGAPKADALRALLMNEGIRRDLDQAERDGRLTRPGTRTSGPVVFDYPEPIGPDPADDQAERARLYNLVRGGTGGTVDVAEAARRVADDPHAPDYVRSVARDLIDTAPDTRAHADTGHAPTATGQPPAVEPTGQVEPVGHPDTKIRPARSRRAVVWPVILLALPAFVAIWGGWVGLGKLTGFGKVNLLPGIGSGWVIDTAITLPIGVETYGAFALYVWLTGRVPARAARFAKWSALGSLAIGALGQVAYHLLIAAGITSAPWWITTLVACLPVAVLGMGAALAHLMHADQ
ncbi:ABC transporter permease [Micromonospora sp. WMMD882]|uniref:ABC transporter permease n=1 Tax=Micromonospora sp. WMMD882 TaxID=3015151 RepID=UPI00248AC2D6|nr:ABC transporter permease [Micromonospora sp. WMMD882]WBB81285.1 ABC transporter permease [Micromonospora sp. WMMD882]